MTRHQTTDRHSARSIGGTFVRRCAAGVLLTSLLLAAVVALGQPGASGQAGGSCFTYLPSPDNDPGEPVLAGDGSIFAYSTSWRSATNRGQLVTMRPDGTDYTVVADSWIDPDTGESFEVSIGTPSLTTDASTIAVNWVARDGLIAVGPDSTGSAFFYGGPGGYGEPDIVPGLFQPKLSADGSRVVFGDFGGTEITVMELPAKSILHTITTPGDFTLSTIRFSGDGQTIYYVQRDTDPFVDDVNELIRYDVATGASTVVASSNQFIRLFDVSADGQRAIFSQGFNTSYLVDDGGDIRQVEAFDLLAGDPQDFGDVRDFESHSLTADGSRWFFTVEDENDTLSLTAVDVEPNGGVAISAAVNGSRFADLTVSDDQSIAIFNNFRPLTEEAEGTNRAMYSWNVESCGSTPPPTTDPTIDPSATPTIDPNAEATVELLDLPTSVLAGEEITVTIEINNPLPDPIDGSGLQLYIVGGGVSEMVDRPELPTGPGGETLSIPANSSLTTTATFRAARTAVDDTLNISTVLGYGLTNVVDVDFRSFDVQARAPIDVHFTLAQLLGCDEVDVIDPVTCPGGGPDNDGQGDYRITVAFEDQVVRTADGGREKYGDLNEREFFTFSETIRPGGEQLRVTISAVDVDDNDDDPIDLSPIDDEMDVVLDIDYQVASGSVGEWTIAGYADPVPGRVQHWTRGDGDTEHVDNGGHPALLGFDVSLLNYTASPFRDAQAGDFDGDGLLDGWEQFGLSVIDVTAANPVSGPVDEYLVLDPTWPVDVGRANPRVPDIYVEHDWLSNGSVSAVPVYLPRNGNTFAEVVESFRLAPVAGVGGASGVNLWVDTGELTRGATYETPRLRSETATGPDWFPFPIEVEVLVNDTLTPNAGDYGIDLGGGNELALGTGALTGIDTVCGVHDNEFKQAKIAGFNESRRWVFRWALMGHASIYPTGTKCGRGGQAEIGGNDSLSLRGDAVVFMHELGHNLELRHGGDSNTHCKSNYFSIMNYLYDGGRGIEYLDGGNTRYLLDFSPPRTTTGLRESASTLNEASLNESVSVVSGSLGHFMRFADDNGVARFSWSGLPADFNGDNDDPPFEDGISVDLHDYNDVPEGDPDPFKSCRDDSPNQVMNDHDDWANFVISFRLDGKAADATELEVSDDSHLAVTDDEIEAFDRAFHKADIELQASLDATDPSVVSTAIRSLDTRNLVGPILGIELGAGVFIELVPDGCVQRGRQIGCSLDSLTSEDTPSAAAPGRFDFTGSGSVTFTATSQDNPLDNDPDPTNNVVTIQVNDQLEPIFCDGQEATMRAVPGVPTIGTDGDDVIVGTDGNDEIDGGDGNDLICAGSGDDTVVGGQGNDIIFGEAGRDILRGQQGEDTVDGGDGNDRLLGGIDGDAIFGRAGDDYLGGFGGPDELFGGSGDDLFWGGFGADIINGGDGDDEIHGLIGNDTINGGPGNDRLDGDRGNDNINGGPGNDIIRGGNANDVLDGGDGNDTVNGGKADDTLSGGNDTDTCTGNLGTDTADNTCEQIFGVP